MLTAGTVVEIYKHKIRLRGQKTSTARKSSQDPSVRGKSSPVSKLYGVSPRTVRDIWNRRTWADVTSHLHDYEAILPSTTSFNLLPRVFHSGGFTVALAAGMLTHLLFGMLTELIACRPGHLNGQLSKENRKEERT